MIEAASSMYMRLHFSLKHLAIVTALVAIALAILPGAMRDASARRALARARAEYSVQWDGPQWIRKSIGEIYGYWYVYDVDLTRASYNDGLLTALSRLSHLDSLQLSGKNMPPTALGHLEDFQALRTLVLEDNAITNDSLKQVAACNTIRNLFIDNAKVDDRGLAIVATFATVKSLGLRGTQVTDAGIECLQHMKLECLNIEDTQISDRAIPQLLAMKSLRQLYVANSRITSEGRARLIKGFPRSLISNEPTSRRK